MKVAKITIYPIKSLGGYAPTQARALPRGFENDRRWMLIDQKGKFITQREYPHLAKWKATVEGDELIISNHDDSKMEYVIENAKPKGEPDTAVTIWNDLITASHVHPKYDKLLLDILGISCKLVYMNSKCDRPVEAAYNQGNSQVSFADGYPYLITTTASIDSLSNGHGHSINMDRFRPNIVVENEIPWEEDTWTKLSIGVGQFDLPKACARCQIPGIHQTTGETDNSIIKSLASQRRQGNKTLFGMNGCIIGDETVIKVGDRVEVIN